jgi:hypothetical protein
VGFGVACTNGPKLVIFVSLMCIRDSFGHKTSYFFSCPNPVAPAKDPGLVQDNVCRSGTGLSSEKIPPSLSEAVGNTVRPLRLLMRFNTGFGHRLPGPVRRRHAQRSSNVLNLSSSSLGSLLRRLAWRRG